MKKISVIMSVFNGGNYLYAAIKSILEQSYEDFEFIIVDDGSTDESRNIIKRFDDKRIILLTQSNKGLVCSLNRAIKESKYEFIARMDADDISEPHRLCEQLRYLYQHPMISLIGTQAKIISENGEYLYNSKLPENPNDIRKYLHRTSPLIHGSVLIRKKVLEFVGGYDNNIHHFIEDLMLWKKISLKYDMSNISEPLYNYRLRYNSLSNRSKRIDMKMNKLCDMIISENNAEEKNKYYDDLNRIFRSIRRRSEKEKLSHYYQNMGRIYLTKNINPAKAKENLYKAFIHNPLNIKIYYYCFQLIMQLLNKDEKN